MLLLKEKKLCKRIGTQRVTLGIGRMKSCKQVNKHKILCSEKED